MTQFTLSVTVELNPQYDNATALAVAKNDAHRLLAEWASRHGDSVIVEDMPDDGGKESRYLHALVEISELLNYEEWHYDLLGYVADLVHGSLASAGSSISTPEDVDHSSDNPRCDCDTCADNRAVEVLKTVVHDLDIVCQLKRKYSQPISPLVIDAIINYITSFLAEVDNVK